MKTHLGVLYFGILTAIFQLAIDFPSASGNTGYRGRVTQHGLNYASQLAVEVLMKYLPVAEIPDLYEKMGSMSVVLSNISLIEFKRPELVVKLIPNNETSSFGGLKIVFSQLDPSVECEMKMTYNWGLFSTTRELSVTVVTSNLSLSLEALIGTDTNGNGVPGQLTCEIEGNVQISSKSETSSVFSGLFDFVANNFNERLKAVIFTQACHNITELLNTSVHNHLSSAIMSRIVLDDDLMLNLKFTESPKFTDNYLEASHAGLMFLTNDTSSIQTPPLRSPPIIPPFSGLSSRMVYAFITDRSVNSIWNSAATAKKMRISITPDTPRVPDVIRRYLSTSCSGGKSHCIGKIFPQIRSLYRQKQVELDLEAGPSQKPYFRFRGRIVRFQIPTMAEFFAKTRNSSRDLLVSASMIWSGRLSVNTKKGQAFFNFTKLSVAMNSSRIHVEALSSPTASSQLEEFVKMISRRVLSPFFKEAGSKGNSLEIPTMPWLKFPNSEIISGRHQNVIVLGTDFEIDIASIPGLQETPLKTHQNETLQLINR